MQEVKLVPSRGRRTVSGRYKHYELIMNYKELVESDKELPLIWLTSCCLYESPFLKEPKMLCHYQIVLAELLSLFNHNPTKLLEMEFDIRRDWFDNLPKEIQTRITMNGGTPEVAYLSLPNAVHEVHLYRFAKQLTEMYQALRVE